MQIFLVLLPVTTLGMFCTRLAMLCLALLISLGRSCTVLVILPLVLLAVPVNLLKTWVRFISETVQVGVL